MPLTNSERDFCLDSFCDKFSCSVFSKDFVCSNNSTYKWEQMPTVLNFSVVEKCQSIGYEGNFTLNRFTWKQFSKSSEILAWLETSPPFPKGGDCSIFDEKCPKGSRNFFVGPCDEKDMQLYFSSFRDVSRIQDEWCEKVLENDKNVTLLAMIGLGIGFLGMVSCGGITILACMKILNCCMEKRKDNLEVFPTNVLIENVWIDSDLSSLGED